jgi:hypothetical protein
MTNFSHILYPSSAALAGISLIAENQIFYVSTDGNDATATGSTAAPYGTLYGAMNAVRNYQIMGNSTVTIRLMKGEHTIGSNIDLYHPQGSNIIIEGDPDAFKQHFLWSVDGYSWNPAGFAGGGHTGSVKVFDVSTGSTLHGFTTGDERMYFCVTNAAFGARSGYKTGATYGIWSSSLYGWQDVGDRFFNHGISYEEGQGILGVGRITSFADTTSAVVEFKNPNYDSRCPAWHMDGGLNNSTAWGGISSNYPETQYSKPNGYYGNASWSTTDGVTAYPAKPAGVAHNSEDPFLVSYYPVVLRGDYSSNSGTLYLRNGSLKAIRNLFFAANDAPFTLVGGGTGSTQNYSQALSALTDQQRSWSENGTAIALENANVNIRHLGFYGVGVAIASHNSHIGAYSSDGIVGSEIRYSAAGSLDSAPVMCATQCKHGIMAKNSVIDFTDSSGLSKKFSQSHEETSCYLSTTGRAIELLGSELKATHIHIQGHGDVAKYLCQVVVPVFAGTTAAGATQAFLSYENSETFWSAYPAAKMFLQPAVGSEQEIGYVNYIVDEGGLGSYTSVNGSTASATPILAGLHPVDYRVYSVYGVKTAPDGLKYMSTGDLHYGITSGVCGGIFSIRFYGDAAASGLSSEYAVGSSTVYVRGHNGVTLGYTNLSSGASASAFLKTLVSTGTNGEYAYCGHGNNAISAMDASTVQIHKALVIQNGGYLPVEVRGGSNMIVGDEQVNVDTGIVGTGGGDTRNDLIGSVCITGFVKHGVLAVDGSNIKIGSLFVKHPLHTSTSENATTTVNNAARAENNSSLVLGNVYAVMYPAHTTVLGLDGANGTGLWTSANGTRYGHKDYPLARNEGVLGAFRNSSISLSDIGEHIFHFDGGTPQFNLANRNMALISAGKGGSVYIPDPNQISSVVSMNSSVGFRFTTDARSTVDHRKVLTRSAAAGTNSGPYVYDRPSTDNQRSWRGKAPSTNPRIGVEGGNIGVAASATDNSARINAPVTGVTYSIFIHDSSSFIFK